MSDQTSSTMAASTQSADPVKLEQRSDESKLWRKMKEAPFVPIGVLGLIGAVTYGVVTRRRGNMSLSVHVMHFRVIAQGMVVGAITLGVGAQVLPDIYKKYIAGKNDSGKS